MDLYDYLVVHSSLNNDLGTQTDVWVTNELITWYTVNIIGLLFDLRF